MEAGLEGGRGILYVNSFLNGMLIRWRHVMRRLTGWRGCWREGGPMTWWRWRRGTGATSASSHTSTSRYITKYNVATLSSFCCLNVKLFIWWFICLLWYTNFKNAGRLCLSVKFQSSHSQNSKNWLFTFMHAPLQLYMQLFEGVLKNHMQANEIVHAWSIWIVLCSEWISYTFY